MLKCCQRGTVTVMARVWSLFSVAESVGALSASAPWHWFGRRSEERTVTAYRCEVRLCPSLWPALHWHPAPAAQMEYGNSILPMVNVPPDTTDQALACHTSSHTPSFLQTEGKE